MQSMHNTKSHKTELRFLSSRRAYTSVAMDTTSATRVIKRYVSTSAPKNVVLNVLSGLYVHVRHASATYSSGPVIIAKMIIVQIITFQSDAGSMADFLRSNRPIMYNKSASPQKIKIVAVYEYIPKFIIFYVLARISKYLFKSKTTVDTNIVTKIMKKYSSSGKPPIKTPMLVSCGKRQISARTAQISHGILKMSAHITQYKNVFLYCERYFQLTAHKTMIGNQTNIMSQ